MVPMGGHQEGALISSVQRCAWVGHREGPEVDRWTGGQQSSDAHRCAAMGDPQCPRNGPTVSLEPPLTLARLAVKRTHSKSSPMRCRNSSTCGRFSTYTYRHRH